MSRPFSSSRVSLNPAHCDPKILCEHLSGDNPLDHEFGRPLFNAGVEMVALMCRWGFRSATKREDIPPEPCHMVAILLQGYLDIDLDGQTVILEPGHLVYFPPNSPFDIMGKKGEITWCAYFRIADNDYWSPLMQRKKSIQFFDQTDLLFLLLRGIFDIHRRKEIKELDLAHRHARLLVGLLSQSIRSTNKSHPDEQKLSLLMEDIAMSPAEDWNVSDMAKSLFMSETKFFRIFKKVYGCPPLEMVIRYRLELAMQKLLDSDLSVEAISKDCGYQSVNSFIRLFNRHVGVPPNQFRNRHFLGRS